MQASSTPTSAQGFWFYLGITHLVVLGEPYMVSGIHTRVTYIYKAPCFLYCFFNPKMDAILTLEQIRNKSNALLVTVSLTFQCGIFKKCFALSFLDHLCFFQFSVSFFLIFYFFEQKFCLICIGKLDPSATEMEYMHNKVNSEEKRIIINI